MKKFLPILSITFLMAACGNNPQSGTAKTEEAKMQAPVYNPDTVGLAQFQQWKAQNELADVDEYNQNVVYAAPQEKAKPNSTTPVRKTVKPRPVAAKRPAQSETSSTSPASETAGGGTMSSESSDAAKASEKKGWSKAAKGAVIGGVAGAAGGAVINKKNPVVGAVIGGVVGAGGGYVIGRKMDKKSGRIDFAQ